MTKCLLPIVAFLLLPGISFAQNQARFSDIKPGMLDGEIEQRAVKIANQRAINLRCPEDYVKAVIISREWQKHYDKNDNVDGRIIHLELYCHFPEGRCAMTDMVFKQKLLSEGGFSRKLYFVGMGDMFTVDCE